MSEQEEAAIEAADTVRKQGLLHGIRRAVCFDPGRSPIATGVPIDFEDSQGVPLSPEVISKNLLAVGEHGSCRDKNPLHAPRAGFEKIELSVAEYYHACGFTYSANMKDLWKRRNRDLTRYHRDIKTAKTASLEAILSRTRYTLQHIRMALAHANKPRMKRLRMKVRMKRQKFIEMFVKRIKGGVENTLVVVGDGQFSSTCGKGKATPTKRLWRMVGQRMKLCYQNEDRTSMLCCGCHQVLGNVMVGTAKGRTPSWKVRRCSNNECHRSVLDRNLSAAINIAYLFLYQVYGHGRPKAFVKGTRPPWPSRSLRLPWLPGPVNLNAVNPLERRMVV